MPGNGPVKTADINLLAIDRKATASFDMKLKHLLPLFLIVALIISAAMVSLVIQLRETLNSVTETQNRRFHSTLLADELRQSSDDLTNFARLYVQTGSKKFKAYFHQILAIRDGAIPRPKGYQGIYWDFIVAKRYPHLDADGSRPISLQQRMHELHFSDEEFMLLEEAKNRSDALSKIENSAFYALEGKYWDDNTKDYTRSGAVDKSLAVNLLYRAEYFETKAAILRPIAEFQRQVDSRTTAELQAVQSNAQTILVSVFIATGSLGSILLMLSWIVYKRVLLRTGTLAKAATKITAGDLNVRSKITGTDELGIFGIVFDKMVSQLAEALELVTASNSRMEDELNVGKDIQMSMVPLTFPVYPEHPEIDLFAKLIPAREVGGDFYDFYFVDDEHLCLTVGDVSGKGVPAALMMAVCRSLLKAKAQDHLSPATIISHVNEAMAAENSNCMFITIFFAVLNIRTGRMVFTNAGHNPALIKSKDGKVRQISTIHGPVVAVVEDHVYKESSMEIQFGDILLAYTDGVTEAHNKQADMYSEERLIQFMSDHPLNSSADFLNDLQKDVTLFENGAEPFDDVTMLNLRFVRR